MDDYDVPPSATPKIDEVVVVNDGLPSESETKICWDNSVINIDEQCPIEPPPSDELCPDGITLVSAGCPPVETEQERLDREAEEARLEMERLETERQDAESAIGAVESEAGGSVELTDVLGICEGDMTNLANFEACRFVAGNSQSTFEKDDTGTTVEMWTHSTFGTKPASWFKAQGLTKPKVDVNKSRAVSTDGTYTWDSVGNVMDGPCGFSICDDDPDAWGVRNRIASTTKDNVGGGQYRAPIDIQYRKELNIWRQANFLDLQSKFGQLEIDAEKAAKAYETAQNAAAAAKTEAERIRLQKIADEAQKEAARLAKEEAAGLLTIGGDDALTSGGTGTTGDITTGTTTTQQSVIGIPTDASIAISGVPAYSLSTGTGLESLAVKGEPTEIKQGDITWLVGNSYAGIAATTPIQPIKKDDTSAPAGAYMGGIGFGIPQPEDTRNIQKSMSPVFVDAVATDVQNKGSLFNTNMWGSSTTTSTAPVDPNAPWGDFNFGAKPIVRPPGAKDNPFWMLDDE
jgi:hypothetical protein